MLSYMATAAIKERHYMTDKIIKYAESRRKYTVYRPGEIIFHQGEFYYLKSGMSLTYTLTEDGRERNILISWPHRLFGASTFFEGHPRRASAIALKTCRVLKFDRALYDECREEFPSFDRFLIDELAQDIGVLFEQLVDSHLLSSDVKVARFICRRLVHGQYAEKGSSLVLDYTQTFIAVVLGLSRWSVNQSLSAMKKKGWVETGHGKLIVLAPDKIRDFAYNSVSEKLISQDTEMIE